jgi:hypothetical protein
MSLIYYAKPFLDLGICKEYRMARKTTGTIATTRKKIAQPPTEPVPEIHTEVREAPRNAKPANPVPFNLEEEIRRRAYELYLQRQARVGNVGGDESQDWLIAEREIRSAHEGEERRTA